MKRPNSPSPLEVWGGLECTLNRVQDTYFDQLERSGHYGREGDLEAFAQLGIRALRFPALWERWCDDPDWSWLDRSLDKLRSLGIRPILGLLHHGSGPRHLSLLDPALPAQLAEYAARVAQRYPWVSDYTPVNEPLTTARFSALYGHWYPHQRDPSLFMRALLNQCRATAQAMEAIRTVQPAARLLQTEDLSKIHGVPELAYQVDFENERRWLSFDLLTGKVDEAHPLWHYLLGSGIGREELQEFSHRPCPPDLLGLNHYVTSERFLDTDLHRYPPSLHGGNGRHRYADVEAVRWAKPDGPNKLLQECWQRFQLPIAITEAHLGCTREEQMRWLAQLWAAAQEARQQGAHIQAVTSWALLGSFDWNSLVTRSTGHYETGAFDLRSQPPRPTAIAKMVGQMARGEEPRHPVLGDRGWWQPSRKGPEGRPILITGEGRPLAQAFAILCERRGLATRFTRRLELDIADSASVQAALEQIGPWAVINTADYARVDDAESDVQACFQVNYHGAVTLARECSRLGLPLMTFSSDLVFDGSAARPYRESDLVGPLGVYGHSKRRGEEGVLAIHPQALVIRTSPYFGPWDRENFLRRVVQGIASRGSFFACPRSIVSPTNLCDLVDASLDLLLDEEKGIWHLANSGSISWLELARTAAAEAGIDKRKVRPAEPHELGWIAARPVCSALASERAALLPSLESGLDRYFRERERIAV